MDSYSHVNLKRQTFDKEYSIWKDLFDISKNTIEISLSCMSQILLFFGIFLSNLQNTKIYFLSCKHKGKHLLITVWVLQKYKRKQMAEVASLAKQNLPNSWLIDALFSGQFHLSHWNWYWHSSCAVAIPLRTPRKMCFFDRICKIMPEFGFTCYFKIYHKLIMINKNYFTFLMNVKKFLWISY